MAAEYFYGVSLSGAGAEVKWDPDESPEYQRTSKLVIKQFLLDAKAKADEYHVVQVSTTAQGAVDTEEGKPISMPVAILKVGESRALRTDLEFPDAPVTFKLVEGAGPVHIHGLYLCNTQPYYMEEEEEDIDEEDEEEGTDEEGDKDDAPAKKKPKVAANNAAAAKATAKAPAQAEKNNKKK